MWAYTAVPDALAFLKRVPPGSTNSSFLDFFFGAGICGQGDPKPCDPIRRTTFAASQLGVPALYPATEVFFERSASGAMPSAEQALANWTAAKAKLPSSGVLGFFLGVRLFCRCVICKGGSLLMVVAGSRMSSAYRMAPVASASGCGGPRM